MICSSGVLGLEFSCWAIEFVVRTLIDLGLGPLDRLIDSSDSQVSFPFPISSHSGGSPLSAPGHFLPALAGSRAKPTPAWPPGDTDSLSPLLQSSPSSPNLGSCPGMLQERQQKSLKREVKFSTHSPHTGTSTPKSLSKKTKTQKLAWASGPALQTVAPPSGDGPLWGQHTFPPLYAARVPGKRR